MPEETESPTVQPRSSSITIQDVLAVVLGLLSVVYLLNPTLGVFELIPDNTPIIGNLDEAAATLMLLAALGHFGIQIPSGVFGGNDGGKDGPNPAP